MDTIFNPLFCSMILSSFCFLSIVIFSKLESGFISFNHLSIVEIPFICNKLIFWCSKESFSAAEIYIPLVPSSIISSSQFLPMFRIESSKLDFSLYSFQSFLSQIYNSFIGHIWTVFSQVSFSE